MPGLQCRVGIKPWFYSIDRPGWVLLGKPGFTVFVWVLVGNTGQYKNKRIMHVVLTAILCFKMFACQMICFLSIKYYLYIFQFMIKTFIS